MATEEEYNELAENKGGYDLTGIQVKIGNGTATPAEFEEYLVEGEAYFRRNLANPRVRATATGAILELGQAREGGLIGRYLMINRRISQFLELAQKPTTSAETKADLISASRGWASLMGQITEQTVGKLPNST